MKKDELPSANLLLTERGEQWLANFNDEDKPIARQLVARLSLVSANEFERGLHFKIMQEAKKFTGPIGLFGVRELAANEHIFSSTGDNTNSTPRGTDIGSEGRIAAMIRNIVRERPEKFLNHPTWDGMRSSNCRHVFFVDDFIGSGARTIRYLSDFYENKTIKSWYSYKLIEPHIIVYSGTANGIRFATKHKFRPSVAIVRSCPTIEDVPKVHKDELAIRKNIAALCKSYAKSAKIRFPMGFGEVGALMVFEHSCPNNCPAILWSSKGDWLPLFHGKAVSAEARYSFPLEIVRRDPVSVLVAAGEKRIAGNAHKFVNSPMPLEWMAVLSLFSKGVRRVDAIEHITGMTHTEASQAIERCVATGLLTQKWRLTNLGLEELRAIKKIAPNREKCLSNESKFDYYPSSLRNHN